MGRYRSGAVPAHFRPASRNATVIAGMIVLLLVPSAQARAQNGAPHPDSVRLPGIDSAVPASRLVGPVDVIDAPDARPGAVVSVVVRVPALALDSSAVYTLTPAEGVRLFGTTTGTLARSGAMAMVPFAFATPRGQPPGPMNIARLDVRRHDGAVWRAHVRTTVGAHHALRLRADTAAVLLERGTALPLVFTLVNAGNATDTVVVSVMQPARWHVESPPALVIEPGGEARVVLRVRAPDDALLGETQIVHVVAAGLGGSAGGNVQIEVGNGVDDGSPWVNMPATATIGISDAAAGGEAPLAVGLDASGRIGRGTDATITLRHTPLRQMAPAFHRYLNGPAVRVGLRRGDNSIEGGDLVLGGAPLMGHVTQGTGVQARLRFGALLTEMYAARPSMYGTAHSGALLHASGELPIGFGTVGVRLADLERPYGISGVNERTSLAAARFATAPRQPFAAHVETGVMRVEDAAGRNRTGAAVDLQTRYHQSRLDITARLRRVPGALATSGPAIDESFIGAGLDLGAGLAVNGWAAHNGIRLLDGAGTTFDGGALALQWRRGPASAQLGGHLSSTESRGFFGRDAARRSVTLGGTAPLGPVRVDGTLEIGRSRTHDAERDLRSVQARASWQHGPLWLWLGTTHTRGLYASSYHRTDIGASMRTRRIEMDAGIGANLLAASADERAIAGWASTTVHTDARTSLVFGLDYARWSASGGGTRVSFGARRAFALPLPLRRRPVASGTVFDDLDGDLVRDPDEPPVPHVRVRRGTLATTSDERGTFAFRSDDAGVARELRVDAATLPQGMMVPPAAALASEGRVDVPLHRAAALRLSLFEDLDGDGVRSANERGSPAALVLVIDDRGRTRTALADSTGTITFRALSPGVYSVRAPGSDRALQPRTLTVRLEPGGDATVEVPVPIRVRAIRFRGPPAGPEGDDGTPASASGGVVPPATGGTRPR